MKYNKSPHIFPSYGWIFVNFWPGNTKSAHLPFHLLKQRGKKWSFCIHPVYVNFLQKRMISDRESFLRLSFYDEVFVLFFHFMFFNYNMEIRYIVVSNKWRRKIPILFINKIGPDETVKLPVASTIE